MQPFGCESTTSTCNCPVARDAGGSMDAIERVIVVPGTPGDVWPAVTDGEEISEWFGAEAELDPRPGGRGVFRWPDGASRHVVVEEVEPAHRLTFRWLPFQRTEDGDIV